MVTTYYAARIPLDPSPSQERQFNRYAGAARFAYNTGLAHIKEQLEERKQQQEAGVAKNDLIKIDANRESLGKWWRANRDTLAPWHKEVSSWVYTSAWSNLAKAYSNFRKSITGKRKGKPVAFPKFKNRRSVKSFAFPKDAYVDDDHHVRLPCIGRVHTLRNARKLVDGRTVKTVTIRKENNRWYASLLCETEMSEPAERSIRAVGIDLGVKILVTCSDGTVYDNPKPLKSMMKELSHAQRALSRKQKGTARYEQQREKVNKIYAQVKHLRNTYIHSMTSQLVNTYTDICIEDLNVSGMTKNHSLARAIADASFAEIRRQLEYKAHKTGTRIHVIDRFYASSKTCSQCGWMFKDQKLSDRTFICGECGMHMDRDMNAAINILHQGMSAQMDAAGDPA